ncbi:MAG: HAMP domain-containing protein [Leptolyngbya sp. SIO1E4]|nr:HAMP domain-containing protein [Leptolyngbya sp. SIO1E4]
MKLSSLFRKTLFCQTLLFGVVVGSLSLTSAYSLRWYLAGEYVSRGSAIARSVSGSTNDLLADDSPDLLQTLLEEFADLQGVAYVLVATPDGELLAHTFGEKIPIDFQANRFKPGNLRAANSTDRRFRRFTHSPNFEKTFGKAAISYRQVENVGYVIDIALPIEAGTQGYVHVGMDQVRMIQQIRSAASLQLWVMLGLLIVSIVATYIMVQRISQPLNQLTEYAKRLANQDFSSPVKINSRDEVGLLATTMHSMATDIQVFIGQLETTLSELQQTQSQLIHSEKMSGLGQLVAGIAHEINNPVSFIACNINYAETYAKQLMGLLAYQHPDLADYLTPELKAALDDMDVDFVMTDFPKVLGSMRLGTERIRGIVTSLQNFSRLHEAEFKAVNIHEGLDSTLMILNSRLKGLKNSIPVQVIKEYADLPQVTCYAGQLNQVFLNLMANALDALETKAFKSQDSPKLRIKTDLNGELVEIHIQDNGCGINSEIAPRVFDPFFTTKPIGQGTGLGLSISYQIVVQHHHGHLAYQSTPDQGTTFTIQIPLHPQESLLPSEDQPSLVPSASLERES